MEQQFDIRKVTVHRTKEGTIFEIVFLILLLTVWGIIIWLMQKAPEIVPTHFGITGEADHYGSPLAAIFPCLIVTVVGICMMAGAYFPRSINVPGGISNLHQVVLATRMMRILGLLTLLLTLSVALSMLALNHGRVIPALSVVAVMLVVCAVFTYLIYRAK